MGVTVDAPLALLLLVPLVGATLLLHAASRRRLGAARRRAALAVRVVVLSALVLALAGVELVLPVDRLAVVFVVDLSDSVGQTGRDDALEFIRDSLAEMPEGDVAGIVAFGKDALVERLPSELSEIDRLASTPVRGATDIGAALRLASALFPDDAQRRIVLLSDGNDTTGAGQTEAALAAARGIQVETRAIGLAGRDEVLVERLRAPSTARLGEEIELVAEVRSTVAQPATLRLYADGALAATERVSLEAGPNAVTFRVTPGEAGFHTFRVVVEAARDTFGQNDRGDAHTIVKGEPRILVAAGDREVATELVGALEAEGHRVDTVLPEALPDDLTGLATYDSVVLVDVPRLRLSDRQLAALQVYVRDLGRGLVAIGGPRSYGAGGYQETPLEETLPVEMGVRDRTKEPDVALVVVIDKSGSMDACHCNTFDQGGGQQVGGVRKVDIGKEAILRAAAAMSATDELGVVAFNEAAHWVVRTAPLGSIGDLQSRIAGIAPEGQTNIFAGLDQAVDALSNARATRRHIILLTDGWSSSGAYGELLERMKAAGITLSTVGAGGGSANAFLEGLAKQGGGRYYAATDPRTIPDIFLKETQKVAGEQIVEEPFHPIRVGSSPILRGLEEGFPELLGYNGTTAKPAAQTVLVTARDDPLLAQWQYGLGRSVAWTSDATGRWAKHWLGWPGFTRFFSQLVAWTFPGEETGGIEAAFVTRAGRTSLRVESVAADGSPRDFYSTRATIVGPDLTAAEVELVQVAPGVYEAPLGEVGAGAYAIRVTQTRPGSTPLGRTLGLVAPTPAEYRELGTNERLLAAIRAATGGREVATGADVWRHDLARTSRFTELWPWLLVLAMLLWPLDVALRRVSLGRRELADARRWVATALRRRPSIAPRPASVEEMLAARERAAGAAARAALLRTELRAGTADDGDAGGAGPVA
ncbi:MAG TPA: VWA domain-containing protein, partial [Candidatus Limnocylindrales bacterium]|nr:VWA domain-containing protein [Candidatus Limnocylindrales bacterium]